MNLCPTIHRCMYRCSQIHDVRVKVISIVQPGVILHNRYIASTTCNSNAAQTYNLTSPGVDSVICNGISYIQPHNYTVGICFDGSDVSYIDAARNTGNLNWWNTIIQSRTPMPWMDYSVDETNNNIHVRGGHYGLVSAQMPTFTNPNNISIVCGCSANTHGITGNYTYDRNSKTEQMMNVASMIRCPTLFHTLYHTFNTPIRIITVKNKLLNMLKHGFENTPFTDQFIAVSVENIGAGVTDSDQYVLNLMSECGMSSELPGIYDSNISIAALQITEILLKHDILQRSKLTPRQQLLAPYPIYYVSTTDYVQHRYTPDNEHALKFYHDFDQHLAKLHSFNINLGITADHGMNDKVLHDNKPKVIYLDDLLHEYNVSDAVVILPITDPYIKHHSGLGSYAEIYLNNTNNIDSILQQLRSNDGIYTAMNRADACMNLELPYDLIGDIVVLGDRHTVLGKSAIHHNIDNITGLRSHGGLEEIKVPMLINQPITHAYSQKLTKGQTRNWHLFDYLLNGIQQ